MYKRQILTVPYGTTDRSEEFQVGSTFLNANYKVVNRGVTNGKFFVDVQLQNDINQSATASDSSNRSLAIDITNNNLLGFILAESGTETNPDGGNVQYYNTDLNLVKWYADTVDKNSVLSFPIMRVSANGSTLYSKITAIFNIAGYIGSSLFIRRGLEALIPNGRNANGTLSNVKFTLSNTIVATRYTTGYDDKVMFLFQDGSTADVRASGYLISKKFPNSLVNSSVVFVTDENKYYLKSASGNVSEWIGVPVFWYTTDGNSTATTNVTSISQQLPVSLVKQTDLDDLKDYVLPIGHPQITLTNTLRENEIWLEGAIVSRETYSKLFAIYGTTYGQGDGSTTFQLPDFRNKALWGSNTFGYISAGLPNIQGVGGSICSWGNSTNGAITIGSEQQIALSGGPATGAAKARDLTFNASKSNALYGKSTTVQPPAIKVRVKTRYQ